MSQRPILVGGRVVMVAGRPVVEDIEGDLLPSNVIVRDGDSQVIVLDGNGEPIVLE